MEKKAAIPTKYVTIIFGLLILSGLYLVSFFNFLLFHTIAEMFSIVVAMSLFMLAWNSRHFMDNNYLLFISIAFLFIGCLDILHTVAYKGMGVFQGYGANLPTQLWIAARYVQSLSLLIAPLFFGRKMKTNFVFLAYIIAISLLLGSIFYWDIFPVCFLEELGLTTFKKISEYIISLFLVVSIFLLHQKKNEFDTYVFYLLVVSIFVTIGSELAFTFYVSVYGLSNLIGHFLKIIAFYLVYKAIIEIGLKKPYSLQFRNLKQSEEGLRKNEQFLSAVIESIQDGISVLDPEFNIVRVNKTMNNLYSHMLPLEGKKCYEAYHGRTEACEICPTLRALKSNKLEMDEVPLIQKHGTTGTLELYAFPMLDDSGKSVGVVEFVRDISHRKRIEKDLNLYKDHLEELVEERTAELKKKNVQLHQEIEKRKSMADMLQESDAKISRQSKVLTGINRVFREALTCESEKEVADTCLSVAENLTGSKFGLLGEKNPEGRFNTLSISNPGWDACKMPGSEATRLIQDMEIRGIDRSTIREGKSRIVNDLASHPDRVGIPEGHPPVTSFLGVPLKHAGETIGMIGLGNKESGYNLADQKAIEDLSIAFVEALMRKRGEIALDIEREKFRVLVEESPLGVSLIGEDGVYKYVNPRFVELFGYTLKDIPRGREWFRKAHPDPGYRAQVISAWFNDLKKTKQGDSQPYTFTVTCKDGSTREIQFIAVTMETGDRCVTYEDLTEQKKLEAQLIQSQKMESIGRLAGGVAHDYNNALSVILGFTELAMDEVDPTGPLRANLNEVLMAARRATDITRQLLAFARKQTIAPKVLDLNESVESMLKMLRRLIGEDIDLAWLPGASLWSVKMDPSQIDQILVNLCVNARDAIEDVGKVTIETGRVTFNKAYCADHADFVPGEFVMLVVSDNGCGIDKEILDNVFEPFFTTKDVDKGTGLGLATVYGIVKQNNGFVNVYSEPGQGTSFKIYLCRHEGKVDDINEEIRVEILPGRGETVLLVEDDLPLLKLAGKMLEGLGYTVLTAGTPAEAIGLAEEHIGEIQLLVTDVIMPEMSGRELAGRLQSLYPGLKCVYMSGYTANVISHHNVLEEEVQFIQKPFSKRDLAKTVKKALDE